LHSAHPLHDSQAAVEAADRVIDAYTTVARWVAQDFKRRTVPPGLTSTQFAILALLEAFESLNVSQLADRLALSVPTVVRAVDALARKDLVVRQRSSQDQREVMIASTETGQLMHAEMKQMRRERVARLLQQLQPDEVEGLVRGYEAMAKVVRTERNDEGYVL
jgi:DNA-binding MarR family transcriptional regulator